MIITIIASPSNGFPSFPASFSQEGRGKVIYTGEGQGDGVRTKEARVYLETITIR